MDLVVVVEHFARAMMEILGVNSRVNDGNFTSLSLVLFQDVLIVIKVVI